MKIGLFGLMFLVMFTLKLAGPMAAVSWFWITMPLWIGAVLCIAFYSLVILAFLKR